MDSNLRRNGCYMIIHVSDVKTVYAFNVFNDSNCKARSASLDMRYISINRCYLLHNVAVSMQASLRRSCSNDLGVLARECSALQW